MAGYLFDAGAYGLLHADITWTSDTIKARLSHTSETPSQTATSMTGIGIAATDVSLGSKTGPTKDTVNHRVTYTAGNPTFTAVGATTEVNKIVVYKFVTNDAGSTPIAVVTFTPAITPNGGDITVTVDAAGLFYTQE